MPIAPVFPGVTTGGSTGVSLLNMGGDVVDLTDGSWTLLDPDSLIDTVSFSGGFNTVTWNVLGSGSQNYQWNAGGEHRAPRWYKALAIDNTAITTDNQLILTTVMALDASADYGDFNQAVVVGAATDASSVVIDTMDGSGGIATRSGTGNRVYGTWQKSASTAVGNANTTHGISTNLRVGRKMIGGYYVGLKAGELQEKLGNRNGNTDLAASTAQHIMVGVGTNGSSVTIAAGDQQRFRATFVAQTINTVIP